MKKSVFSFLICILILTTVLPVKTYALSNEDIHSVINGIINWEKSELGYNLDSSIINDTVKGLAGTSDGDWYSIALSQFDYSDDYQGYLNSLSEYVHTCYVKSGGLSSKSTEWHRISLAILACGGDPILFSQDENGNPINLISDGVYNRGLTSSLGRQGITGWIWGLIALDSMRYQFPENSYYSRNSIITEILKLQLSDGGFALSGLSADPDITAQVIQALAPYRYSSETYTYTLTNQKQTVSKKVGTVIDESLKVLSSVQNEDGGYSSWGTPNSESTSQVIIALCTLGINPETDEQFIKNSNSSISSLMNYRMQDGGFAHTISDNKSSDSLAGEQALLAFVSYYRFMHNMRTIYDFRNTDDEYIITSSVSDENSVQNVITSPPVNTADEKSITNEQTIPISSGASSEMPSIKETELEKTSESIKITNVSSLTYDEADFSDEEYSSSTCYNYRDNDINKTIIFILCTVSVCACLIFIFIKKNTRILFKNCTIVLVIGALLSVITFNLNIQSVDDYYLDNIDSINKNSETVIISICCKNVLNNFNKLDSSLKDGNYIPEDGFILKPVEYVLRDNDTVFDILQRTVKYNRIQIEYQGALNNSFNSVYIKGIGNLYEFSCGELSGWVYKVNGKIPGTGCNNYKLNGNDIIEFIYTCDLGRDV